MASQVSITQVKFLKSILVLPVHLLRSPRECLILPQTDVFYIHKVSVY
jgi:hypothetical protein